MLCVVLLIVCCSYAFASSMLFDVGCRVLIVLQCVVVCCLVGVVCRLLIVV